MKQLITLLFFLVSFTVQGQVYKKLNYNADVRGNLHAKDSILTSDGTDTTFFQTTGEGWGLFENTQDRMYLPSKVGIGLNHLTDVTLDANEFSMTGKWYFSDNGFFFDKKSSGGIESIGAYTVFSGTKVLSAGVNRNESTNAKELSNIFVNVASGFYNEVEVDSSHTQIASYVPATGTYTEVIIDTTDFTISHTDGQTSAVGNIIGADGSLLLSYTGASFPIGTLTFQDQTIKIIKNGRLSPPAFSSLINAVNQTSLSYESDYSADSLTASVGLDTTTAFLQLKQDKVGGWQNALVIQDTSIRVTGVVPFRLSSLTTTQRDAVNTPVNGDLIYNTTNSDFEGWVGGAWVGMSRVLTETVTSTPHSAGDYRTILADDDAVAGVATINLGPAASLGNGSYYYIKKLGSTANVIVDAFMSETIDGATTKVLTTQYESVLIISDGTNWHIF